MTDRAVRSSIIFAFVLMLLPATNAFSQEQEYPAMEGVSSVQTVFDFRVGDPEVALAI